MAKKRASAVKTLDDFIEEVNRCSYGTYEIGLDENTETFGTMRATLVFQRARWEFVGDSSFGCRLLVLYNSSGNIQTDKIRIENAESVELLRGNEFGATYVITAGDIKPERHMFILHYAPVSENN